MFEHTCNICGLVLCICRYCSTEACQLRIIHTPQILQQLTKLCFRLHNEIQAVELILQMSLSLENHHYLAAPKLLVLLVPFVKKSVSNYKKTRCMYDRWAR